MSLVIVSEFDFLKLTDLDHFVIVDFVDEVNFPPPTVALQMQPVKGVMFVEVVVMVMQNPVQNDVTFGNYECAVMASQSHNWRVLRRQMRPLMAPISVDENHLKQQQKGKCHWQLVNICAD